MAGSIALLLTLLAGTIVLTVYYGHVRYDATLAPGTVDIIGDVIQAMLQIVAMYMGYIAGRGIR